MGKSKMSFYSTKGMLYNCLSSFIIVWIFFDVIIIDIHCILVLTSMNNAFRKFGTLGF